MRISPMGDAVTKRLQSQIEEVQRQIQNLGSPVSASAAFVGTAAGAEGRTDEGGGTEDLRRDRDADGDLLRCCDEACQDAGSYGEPYGEPGVCAEKRDGDGCGKGPEPGGYCEQGK